MKLDSAPFPPTSPNHIFTCANAYSMRTHLDSTYSLWVSTIQLLWRIFFKFYKARKYSVQDFLLNLEIKILKK